MTHDHNHNGGPPGPAAADPIDAFFDNRADEATAERLASALRSDVRTAGDFVRTQRMVSMFKAPVEGPDLTESILRRLDERQRFGMRIRRTRIDGRLAACIGLAVGAVALWALDRYTPRSAPIMAPSAIASAPAAVATPKPSPAPAPAIAARPAPKPTRRQGSYFAELHMGTMDLPTLAKPHGGELVIAGGSGGSVMLPALPAVGWAVSPSAFAQQWTATSGVPLLAIPALKPDGDAQSGLLKLPAANQ